MPSERIRLRKANRFEGDTRYEVVGLGEPRAFAHKKRALEVLRAGQRLKQKRRRRKLKSAFPFQIRM